MRERIAEAIKDAMRAKNQMRVCTLRLMAAALKDQDIAKRAHGDGVQLDDAEVRALLTKMVRQREESARIYEEAGRMDMAERERAEQAETGLRPHRPRLARHHGRESGRERDTGARITTAIEGQSRAADHKPLTSALRYVSHSRPP